MFFALLTMLLINAASGKHFLVKTKKESNYGNDMMKKLEEVVGEDYMYMGADYSADMISIGTNLAAGKIPTDDELIKIKNIVSTYLEGSSKDTEIMKLMLNLQKAVPWAKMSELIPYEKIQELLPVPLDEESLTALKAIYQLKVPSDQGLIALKNYVIKVAETAESDVKE